MKNVRRLPYCETKVDKKDKKTILRLLYKHAANVGRSSGLSFLPLFCNISRLVFLCVLDLTKSSDEINIIVVCVCAHEFMSFHHNDSLHSIF